MLAKADLLQVPKVQCPSSVKRSIAGEAIEIHVKLSLRFPAKEAISSWVVLGDEHHNEVISLSRVTIRTGDKYAHVRLRVVLSQPAQLVVVTASSHARGLDIVVPVTVT